MHRNIIANHRYQPRNILQATTTNTTVMAPAFSMMSDNNNDEMEDYGRKDSE